MLCLFAVFAFSCNEEMERLLTDDYPESGTEYTTGHVLDGGYRRCIRNSR